MLQTQARKSESGDSAPASCVAYASRLSALISSWMDYHFARWGNFVGKRPGLVILCALVFFAICASGIPSLEEQTDNSRLWTPKDSRAQKDRNLLAPAILTAQLCLRLRNCILPRLTPVSGVPHPANISSFIFSFIFVPSLLGDWQEALDVFDQLKNISVPGKLTPTIDYTYLCSSAYGDGACFDTGLFALWNFNRTTLNADPDVLATINNNANSESVVSYLGGVTKNGAGQITGARGLLWVMHMKGRFIPEGAQRDDIESWEIQYDNQAEAATSGTLKYYPLSGSTFNRDFSDAIQSDLAQLQIAISLIVIYTMAVLGSPKSLVHSRALLGLGGIACVGLAYGAAMGLMAYVGARNNPLIQLLPFILLGIGIDDMFIIAGTFARVSLKRSDDPIKTRLSAAMAVAGVSITITSFTDMVAFLLGSTTSLPALKDFCYFAAAGIILDFFFQVTVFPALLVYDERRILASRSDCLPCIKRDAGKLVDSSENRPGAMARFFEHTLAPMLHKKSVQVAVAAVFIGLLAAGTYGASSIETELTPQWFLPDDSEAFKYLDAEEAIFGSLGFRINIVVTTTAYSPLLGNYQALIDRVDATDYIQVNSTSAWFTAYTTYNTAKSKPAPTSQDEFLAQLNAFLADTATDGGSEYVRDVSCTLEGNTTHPCRGSLQATRFFARHTIGISADTQQKIDAMDAIRASLDSYAGLASFAYSFEYLDIEQFKVLGREAALSLSLALVAVFIISLLTLGHPTTALLVTICVGIVDMCLLALMVAWDVPINSVSVINLVLAVALTFVLVWIAWRPMIGLAVDYSAHVAHAFMVTPDGDSKERAQAALGTMGASVFHGGFSTFLAVVALAGAKSIVFIVFFKMFFGIIIFGLATGMLLLPILLERFGPPPARELIEAEERVYQSDAPPKKDVEMEPTFSS